MFLVAERAIKKYLSHVIPESITQSFEESFTLFVIEIEVSEIYSENTSKEQISF